MIDSRPPFSLLLPELERLIDKVALEDGPALIGDLERLKARLFLRLIEASRLPPVPPERREADLLLSVSEAAKLLAVKTRWLRDHAHEVPARVQLPGRATRFSKRKLMRWIEQRSA